MYETRPFEGWYRPLRYRVQLAPYFYVDQAARPKAWWRMWQWLLLGWLWEEINNAKT